jgi:hypothetical protein
MAANNFTCSWVMTLDNLGSLNANGPSTVIGIQRKRLKQLLNITAGSDPCKKGNFTWKIIHSNYKSAEDPQLNYNKLPSIVIIIIKCK